MGEAEPRVVGASDASVVFAFALAERSYLKAVSTAGCKNSNCFRCWFASHVGRMSWIHSDG